MSNRKIRLIFKERPSLNARHVGMLPTYGLFSPSVSDFSVVVTKPRQQTGCIVHVLEDKAGATVVSLLSRGKKKKVKVEWKPCCGAEPSSVVQIIEKLLRRSGTCTELCGDCFQWRDWRQCSH